MKHTETKNLTLAAMFFAIGLVLPFLTGQIPQIGGMLLPMHIPVFLCGLVCGWKYGGLVGLVLPITRSLIFTMPPLIPIALAMTFELAVYGLVVGLIYGLSRWKCLLALYRAMAVAMVAGRIAWGTAMVIILGVGGGAFTWAAFVAGAFVNALPGIILQLVLIPAIMVVLGRTGLVPFHKHRQAKAD